MRLTADEQQVFHNVARQFPRFVEAIERLRLEELEKLPYATNSLDVQRGRVQSLTEMQKALEIRK